MHYMDCSRLQDPHLSNAFIDCFQASKVLVKNKQLPSEFLAIYDAIEMYLRTYKPKQLL
jgi:hypothetical protein